MAALFMKASGLAGVDPTTIRRIKVRTLGDFSRMARRDGVKIRMMRSETNRLRADLYVEIGKAGRMIPVEEDPSLEPYDVHYVIGPSRAPEWLCGESARACAQ